MEVHERIKQRRKELELTADAVAKALGVSRATVYRYESADIEKMPLTILEPLSKVLMCSPGYLMGWEDAAATPDSSDLMEKTLVTNYRKLSGDGKKDLVKRSDELVQLESLRKESRLGKDA